MISLYNKLESVERLSIAKDGSRKASQYDNLKRINRGKMSTDRTESIEVLVERPVTCSTILQADETALLQLLT